MPPNLQTPGQCAFCAFRASRQRFSSPKVHHGARRHASVVRKIITRLEPWETFISDRRKRPGDLTGNRFGDRNPNRVHRPVLPAESTYDAFGSLLEVQVRSLAEWLRNDQGKQRVRGWGIESDERLEIEIQKFTEQVASASTRASKGKLVKEADNPLFYHLRRAFVTGHIPALFQELRFRFMSAIIPKDSSTEATQSLQKKIADLRYPLEWYPATRSLQRTVHLHVGPTNSGKTYHALKRLEEAKTGIYAGPLRLLAHEVYTRFNAKGKRCALITGEERRIPEGSYIPMSSCTVEMVPLNNLVDVAVIDEIQMLADDERGWAWTQAFLGVMAKEVHLCGELRTVQLITELCAAMGDKLIVHRYERLGPLKPQEKSLGGDLRKLETGDAIITFSRLSIHALKGSVERTTGKRCAVVYGSLPPETRAQQAALFNDPNNDYDYLVASNAVGMGLNLSIKRIIFDATSKHDGFGHRRLEVPEINQIAGRAGRFKSAHEAIQKGTTEAPTDKVIAPAAPNIGYVTTLDHFDLPIVKKAMKTDPGPLQTAGILPPTDIIARFAALFPSTTPLSYVLLRLNELTALSPQFHVCRLKDQIDVADLIQPYKMTLMDRIGFLAAPMSLRDAGFPSIVVEMAQCISNQSGGNLLDLKALPIELIDQDIWDHENGSKGYLRGAEMLHKGITLYLWLSYRFAGVFKSQALAFHVKALIEEKIDECLSDIRYDLNIRQKLNLQRFHIARKREQLQQKAEGKGILEVDANSRTNKSGKTSENLGGGHDAELSPASGSDIPIPAEWLETEHDSASTATS